MLRRCLQRLDWKEKVQHGSDRRGRFSLDEAAAELGLDPAYAHALYKPLHYTFDVKGVRYPSQRGRASRPGAAGTTSRDMFPLWKRDPKLDRQLHKLPKARYSTF